jgi:hypothetical protein
MRTIRHRACRLLLCILLLLLLAGPALPNPSAALAQTQPSLQAHEALADSGVELAQAQGYIYPTLDAPPNDAEFWCLKINPSCGRDPWYVQFMEYQAITDYVQYSFLGPGLRADYRLTEAIWLLWQWNDGKYLLRRAAEGGYTIRIENFGGTAIASYSRRERRIRVNLRYSDVSNWMVADMLAHELKHAIDDLDGGVPVGQGTPCYLAEYRAFIVEKNYLSYIYRRFGGFPSLAQMQSRTSTDDVGVYQDLMNTWNSTPEQLARSILNNYYRQCTV